MAKCGYPPCVVQIESGGENPPLFCEKHLAVPCKYAEIGQCKDTIIPGSGWCKVHNDEVVRFDFIHGRRHQQAEEQMMAHQQAQRLLGQQGGNGQGMKLLRP